jgi:hypothetical protein
LTIVSTYSTSVVFSISISTIITTAIITAYSLLGDDLSFYFFNLIEEILQVVIGIFWIAGHSRPGIVVVPG